MKTGILLVTLLGLLTSCAKETSQNNSDTIDPGQPSSETICITAGAPSTKTTMGEGTDGKRPVYWSDGDRIAVNGYTSSALSGIAPRTSTAQFYVSAEATTPYKGVYPASIYKDATTVTLPATQVWAENTFASNTYPIAGYSAKQDETLLLRPLCSILKISIKQDSGAGADTDELASIAFSGNNGEQVCGDFSINYENATLTGASTRESDRALGMMLDKPLSTEKALDIYLVVPAITYSAGFTLTITDVNNRVMTQATNKSQTLTAGVLEVVPEFVFTPTVAGRNIPISLLGRTSSSLSFTWKEELDGSTQSVSNWKAELFAEGNETTPVRSYNLPSSAFSGQQASFVFSGLNEGADYRLKITDLDNNFTSRAFLASTEAFTNITMPASFTAGEVALAENFGQLRWNSDIVAQAAGYEPATSSSFNNDYTPDSEAAYLPGNTEISQYPLWKQTNALPSSRLNDWACAVDSKSGQVYVRPGYVEIRCNGSTRAKKGWLFTPAFGTGSVGKLKVNISFTACSYTTTESNVWCVAAVDPANVTVSNYQATLGSHPTAEDKIQHFTVDPGTWQTVSKNLTLADGDRIMIGLKASYTPAGDYRLFIRDIRVTVTEVIALEDPLTFVNGQKVTTTAQWAERREEILEIFQREMYGWMPAASPIYYELIESGNTTLPALSGVPAQAAVREQYRMWFKSDKSGPSVVWLLVRPASASGPVPTILNMNFYGNHEFMNDTQVLRGDSGRGSGYDQRGIRLDPSNRYYTPLNVLISRGYAFLTAFYEDITGDPEPYVASEAMDRVFTLWGPRDESRTDNTMALDAWAWGIMRGVDLIQELDALADDKTVAVGCSRLGKATLIAGAFDQRIPVVVPVQTGSGGAPLTKHITKDKESIASETETYPHWFCKKYATYAGKEDTMPFDQHLLLSCVAPRALLIDGFNHKWFDTEGEWLSVKAASPVWTFLGKEGLPDVSWPVAESTAGIGRDLGYVRRPGTKAADHGIILQDWNWIMDFADPHVK